MDKQATSRWINGRTGGDPDEMFCARVYVQQRLWGGWWIPVGYVIDVAFWIRRGQRSHVRATYMLQRRQDQCKRRASNNWKPGKNVGHEFGPGATGGGNGVAGMSQRITERR